MFRKDKKKGVEDLIEIENPNRVVKKNIKAKDADVNARVELSRRERYVVIIYCTVHVCIYVPTTGKKLNVNKKSLTTVKCMRRVKRMKLGAILPD